MEIILFGNRDEHDLSDFLLEQLVKRYECFYFNGDMAEKQSASGLKVYETDELNQNNDDCIIILKNKANLSRMKLIHSSTFLVNSDNREQLKAIAKLDYPAIACGMSNKDSITFSSIGTEQSVISVQRSLVLCDRTIEPLEIPVAHLQWAIPYGMLCYAAVVLALEPDRENISFDFR